MSTTEIIRDIVTAHTSTKNAFVKFNVSRILPLLQDLCSTGKLSVKHIGQKR